MINRKFFFDTVRTHLFRGALTQPQVAGLGTIVDEWEESHAKEDDRWLAYMLATVFHETARTMQPIHEYGGDKYFSRRYDKAGERPQVAKALGNTQAGDGVRFHGRGYVQLTGRANYTKMGDLLKVDLAGDPDLALQPDVASNVMFVGMIRGLFTGRKLPDYFNETTDDWVQARKIINGLDHATDIAAYGKAFYGAISYTVG